MDLVFRLTEERDLAECLTIVDDWSCYGDALRERLPGVLARLLGDRVLNSAVLEDRRQPAGSRIVQFGASVFVTDAFVRDVALDPAPHLARRVVQEIVAGDSPVLTLPEIRAANSRNGLNLLVLQFGVSADRIPPDEWPTVVVRFPESFFFLHQGYNLKEILLEFWDPRIVAYSLEAGFRLRSDYKEYYRRHHLPIPVPGCGPQRLGISREEAQAASGTYIAKIFPYRRPQFAFTPAEQLLLIRALLGDTDEEAARALHLAVPTIKTRWREIYGRVQDRAPDLLPANGSQQTTRGGEKRRLLLNYLRQHFEELRPVESSSSN